MTLALFLHNPKWVSAEIEGTAAPTELILSASTRTLTAGSYSAVVQVSSLVAPNNFAEVGVSFTIEDGLSLGGTPG